MTDFNGFPKETFTFLKNLKKNNSKKWLDAHRDEYDTHLMEPARHFVVAMGEKLKALSPKFRGDPRVNGSIRRMARDIRFSKDKTPYKTYLDIMFREGDDKLCSASALVLRLQENTITLGVGIHEFAKPKLAAYRDGVVDPKKSAELGKAIAAVKKAGFAIHGTHYRRVPRGYDPEHKRAAFLLHKGLYAGADLPLPESIGSAKFLTHCTGQYRKLMPLHRWLESV